MRSSVMTSPFCDGGWKHPPHARASRDTAAIDSTASAATPRTLRTRMTDLRRGRAKARLGPGLTIGNNWVRLCRVVPGARLGRSALPAWRLAADPRLDVGPEHRQRNGA